LQGVAFAGSPVGAFNVSWFDFAAVVDDFAGGADEGLFRFE